MIKRLTNTPTNMKKIILALVSITFVSINAIAQTTSEHLTFKGVPIDGTLSQYVTKMKSAGFEYLGEQNKTALLRGEFAGFKDCIIGVSTLESVNIVSTIGVIFPSCSDWSSLENNYNHLKSMLTSKYGEPADVVETFQSSITPKTNNENYMNYSWTDVPGTRHLKQTKEPFKYPCKRVNMENIMFCLNILIK